MSVRRIPKTVLPRAPRAARAALALYPPAWRARYEDEILALLEEAGGGLPTVASLAWRAVPAWIWSPRHLHDRAARMRASVSIVLVAWSALVGLGLVFAQLTQLQNIHPRGHPIIGWSYAVFDTALLISGIVLVAGSVPLWLVMLRRARREHIWRDGTCLLLPVAAPAAYLCGLIITARIVRHAHGIGPGWFLAVTVAGFAAAGIAAAGPGATLRRQRPRGLAVRLAVISGAVAVVVMMVASAASVAAGTGLYLWAHDFAGYQHVMMLGMYLTLVAVAEIVAVVGAARGAAAALTRTRG
jgi:hypothetical protein